MPRAAAVLASLERWAKMPTPGMSDSGTAAGSPTRHGGWGVNR